MADVTLDTSAEVALVTFHRPVLSERALAGLLQALDALGSRTDRIATVLRSLHPTIFLAGAHLAEIAALESGTSGPYAVRGRAVLDRLGRMPGPTVAAVDGSCTGGGFDLVLACDRIVAGAHAAFSHPGVHRGLVTGWGGTVRLPAVAGRRLARIALTAGQPLDVSDLAPPGVVSPTTGDVVAAAIALARRLTALHPARLRLWRALRDRPHLRDGWHHRL
jgi:enoyl-CoA hydratase